MTTLGTILQLPGRLLTAGMQVVTVTGQVVELVPRVITLVGEAETLLNRASSLISGVERLVAVIDGLVGTIEGLVGAVEPVLASVEQTQQRALAQVDRVAGIATTANHTVRRTADLLDGFSPSLDKIRPIVERIARTTDANEVESLVQLVDLLPEIMSRLNTDVLPVLDTLGTVAPDLRDLLNVSRELNEILGSIPGLGWIKGRAEKRVEEIAAEREEIEPVTVPERT